MARPLTTMLASFRLLVCSLAVLGSCIYPSRAATTDLFSHGHRSIPDSIDPCAIRMVDGDEIWIVSSRCIGTCGANDLNRLECFRWLDLRWQQADWRSVLAGHQSNDGKRTIVYLHGNRTDLSWSASRGLQVFDAVLGSESNRGPVRFVIWSWPTDPKLRRAREYRENSARSLWEGGILAQFLNQLGGKSTIGLIGYSFGAQSVVSAVEQVGRDNSVDGPLSFRVACVAPAYQKPWSDVSNPFAACQGCVTTPLQLTNSQDRALRAHQFVSHFSAGGYAWMTIVDEMSPNSPSPENIDVGNLVGRRHNVVLYVLDPTVARLVRSAVLANEETPPNAPLPGPAN